MFFFDNVIDFAMNVSTNRGTTSGFNIENPEKWNKCLPMLKQVDSLYKNIFQLL